MVDGVTSLRDRELCRAREMPEQGADIDAALREELDRIWEAKQVLVNASNRARTRMQTELLEKGGLTYDQSAFLIAMFGLYDAEDVKADSEPGRFLELIKKFQNIDGEPIATFEDSPERGRQIHDAGVVRRSKDGGVIHYEVARDEYWVVGRAYLPIRNHVSWTNYRDPNEIVRIPDEDRPAFPLAYVSPDAFSSRVESLGTYTVGWEDIASGHDFKRGNRQQDALFLARLSIMRDELTY